MSCLQPIHPDELNAVTGHVSLPRPRTFMMESTANISDLVMLADERMRKQPSRENAGGLTSKTMLNS